MPDWYVEICPYPLIEGEASKLGPFDTERIAERVQRGVNINLDHERYYTVVSSVTSKDRGSE